MRKVLIIAFGLASLGALATQPASAAQTCRMVCDQSAIHNGQTRCFSSHKECTNTKAVGGGAVKTSQKTKKNN